MSWIFFSISLFRRASRFIAFWTKVAPECLYLARFGEFRAWLVRAVFRANSEQIPGKFRANSGQIPSKNPKPSISLSFCVCNESPWLADNKEHISSWGETDHARNLAVRLKMPLHMCFP